MTSRKFLTDFSMCMRHALLVIQKVTNHFECGGVKRDHFLVQYEQLLHSKNPYNIELTECKKSYGKYKSANAIHVPVIIIIVTAHKKKPVNP